MTDTDELAQHVSPADQLPSRSEGDSASTSSQPTALSRCDRSLRVRSGSLISFFFCFWMALLAELRRSAISPLCTVATCAVIAAVTEVNRHPVTPSLHKMSRADTSDSPVRSASRQPLASSFPLLALFHRPDSCPVLQLELLKRRQDDDTSC